MCVAIGTLHNTCFYHIKLSKRHYSYLSQTFQTLAQNVIIHRFQCFLDVLILPCRVSLVNNFFHEFYSQIAIINTADSTQY